MDANYIPEPGVPYVVTDLQSGHGFGIGEVVYLADVARPDITGHYNGPFSRTPDGPPAERPYMLPLSYELAETFKPLLDNPTIDAVESFLQS